MTDVCQDFVQTISIAIPGSILNNAQSPELRSYLSGQIARAAAIYCVDEVIVYDETSQLTDALVLVVFVFILLNLNFIQSYIHRS